MKRLLIGIIMLTMLSACNPTVDEPIVNHEPIVYEEFSIVSERTISGSEFEVTEQFDKFIKSVDDYLIVTERSWNHFVNEIYIYKLSDPTYKRIIDGDNNFYLWENHLDTSIHIFGDYIIIGAHNTTTYQGAVYIYKLSDPTYEKIITGSDLVYDDEFGKTIVIDDDYIIVGAANHNLGKGSVYVYKFSDPSYERIIDGSDLEPYDHFGESIEINEDYIIVGASNQTNDRGAIYIYKFSDSSYERKVVGTDLGVHDFFGDNMTIHEDYIIVRIIGYYITTQSKVYIYKFSDPDYERIILGNDSDSYDSYDYFAYNLEVIDDYLIISADCENEVTGAVYIYKFSDSSYERKIIGSDSAPYENFGFVFTIKDDYVLITARGNNNYQGAVYVYKLSDPSYERKITGTFGAGEHNFFGDTIEIQGDYIIIGATGINDFRGAIFIFRLSDPDFEETITPSRLDPLTLFGNTFIVNNDYIIVYLPSHSVTPDEIYIYKVFYPED